MPIVRKLIKIGDSKGISIPKSWIDYIEEKNGKLTRVAIEVNSVLTLSPILDHQFVECHFWAGHCLKGRMNFIAASPSCENFEQR